MEDPLFVSCATCGAVGKVWIMSNEGSDALVEKDNCPRCSGNGMVLTPAGKMTAKLFGLEVKQDIHYPVVGELEGCNVLRIP